MPAAKYAITIYQGDDWLLTFRLRNPDLTYEDLTGKVGKAQIRATATSETVLAEFIVTVLDQTVAGTRGSVRMALTSAQTAALPAAKAVWDVQLANADGTGVSTRVGGEVVVVAQVTR